MRGHFQVNIRVSVRVKAVFPSSDPSLHLNPDPKGRVRVRVRVRVMGSAHVTLDPNSRVRVRVSPHFSPEPNSKTPTSDEL